MTFSLISWAAIYFIVWWITLFAILPFGVRSQAEEGEVAPGTDPGAPASIRVLRIAALTTLAATVIFLFVVWVLTQNLFGLADVPFLPGYTRL